MKVLVLNPTDSEDPKSIAKLINTQAQKNAIEVAIVLANIKDLVKHDISIPVYSLNNGICSDNITNVKIGNQSSKIAMETIGEKVDIFISKDWPRRIALEQSMTQFSSHSLDSMIKTAMPRYWFAYGDEKDSAFLERMAFQPDDSQNRVTRFISLAKKGHGRWYYAFSLPYEDDITSIKTSKLMDAASTLKRPAENDKEDTVKRIHLITPMECFMCPINPKFESHMVIEKMPNSYMAITKGPLGLENGKGFIGHGMIVPIDHTPFLPRPLKESPFFEDFKIYKERLIKLFLKPESSLSNTNAFSLVFWHISNRDQVHSHIQFLPILQSQGKNLERTIRKQIDFDQKIAKRKKLQKEKLTLEIYDEGDTSLWPTIEGKSFIYFGLYQSDGSVKQFVLPLENVISFDHQFPRKVIAVLINQKQNINWKNCCKGTDFEKKESEAFQKHYNKSIN